ncbi:MAG: DUF3261 domain-containing protein [Azoarcus sp.]|jgi:hypothetical protein|nr:DUF3261 domain-containing protein [Azoarcus sp.]
MRARLTAGLFYVCCVLCLGACALPAPGRETLAPGPLRIAPAALGERTVEQRLVMRWPGGERATEAVLEIAEGRLQLVMMAFGMRLVSLVYDGETLTERRFVPHAPEGARILNDLLLIAAPLEDLRRALPPGASVTETHANGGLRREIALDGMMQAVIDYETESPWQGRVAFAHLAMKYELILESHEI